MTGGVTNQRNKTAGLLNPSKNNSYCALPPIDPYRSEHTMTGFMACGGVQTGASTSCSTFNTARGVWEESHQFQTRHFRHVAWNNSEGVMLMGGWENSYSTTLLLHGGGSRPGFMLKEPCQGCCGASDPYTNTVILSGGYSYRTNVVRYGPRGYMNTLPYLRSGRHYHGCAIFYTDYRMPVKRNYFNEINLRISHR